MSCWIRNLIIDLYHFSNLGAFSAASDIADILDAVDQGSQTDNAPDDGPSEDSQMNPNDDSDYSDSCECESRSKTTYPASTEVATAATTTTTTTTTTTVATTTSTTNVATSAQLTTPADICLVHPHARRNKRMISEEEGDEDATEEDDDDCVCIFKKLHDEIKGKAKLVVGECGEVQSSPDLFPEEPTDGELIPLERLLQEDAPDNAYGSPHMLDTVMVRGGLFRKDLWLDEQKQESFIKKKYVCGKHYKQFGLNWMHLPGPFNSRVQIKGIRVPACNFPSNVQGAAEHQKQVPANRGSYASRKHSKVLLAMKNGSFIQMGAPLCRRHQEYLDLLEYEYGVGRTGHRTRPATKKPLAEAPSLSQLSGFLDEPLQLSQDYRLTMSQEVPGEQPPPTFPTQLKSAEEQSTVESEVKGLSGW